MRSLTSYIVLPEVASAEIDENQVGKSGYRLIRLVTGQSGSGVAQWHWHCFWEQLTTQLCFHLSFFPGPTRSFIRLIFLFTRSILCKLANNLFPRRVVSEISRETSWGRNCPIMTNQKLWHERVFRSVCFCLDSFLLSCLLAFFLSFFLSF